MGALAVLAALACATCFALSAAAAKHSYAEGDKVKLWANVVGPFSNPSVTYQYYERLPFCQPPDGLVHKPATLGELVDGNRLVLAPYEISFRADKERVTLCTKQLTRREVQHFQAAIRNDFYFQMVLDDSLPMWGFVGKLEKVAPASAAEPEKHRRGFNHSWILLFTHMHFDIAYNLDRVIEVNVSTDAGRAVDISEDMTPNTEDGTIRAEFTYSVVWLSTDTPYARRMEKYRRVQFLPQHLEIHWFSIVNSCVMVLLLTGFLATILLRVLRNDFMRFSCDDDSMEDTEESGWKYCHGDVFRFPPSRTWFCALVGTGTQLLWLGIFIFLLSCVGAFAPYSRGSMYTALIVLYAATAGIAGYTAGSYYRQMGGTAWVRNCLLTCTIFCGPFFIAFCINNTIAIAYHSTAAFPFGTIVIIAFIWALVTIPLTILGCIIGKNTRTEFRAPCRTTKYPREVPDLPWYRSALPQMLLAGFLPFSAIYIELYYIFASVWGHKIYTIYPILFIVFIILLVVTAFICVAMTYFQLAAEDHRWWWRSFLCGGATGLFVYGYAVYFYFARSDMSGLMQSCFFFGYVACVCLGFFIMLGTVGWQASLLFVRHIYKAIKCE